MPAGIGYPSDARVAPEVRMQPKGPPPAAGMAGAGARVPPPAAARPASSSPFGAKGGAFGMRPPAAAAGQFGAQTKAPQMVGRAPRFAGPNLTRGNR